MRREQDLNESAETSLRARATMAENAAAGREDNLSFRDLPDTFEDYHGWRFHVRAGILSAGTDPALTVQYLAELDDVAHTPFISLYTGRAAEMDKIDYTVFAAVLAACRNKTAMKATHEIMTTAQFGCGRQCIRIIDKIFGFEAQRVSMRATSMIMALTCSSMAVAEDFVSKFQLYR